MEHDALWEGNTPYDIKGALCGLVTTFLVIIVETLLNSSCLSPFKVDFQEFMLNKTRDTNIEEEEGNNKCTIWWNDI